MKLRSLGGPAVWTWGTEWRPWRNDRVALLTGIQQGHDLRGGLRRGALPSGQSIAHAYHLLAGRKYLNKIAGLSEGHYSSNCHESRNFLFFSSLIGEPGIKRASWPDREDQEASSFECNFVSHKPLFLSGGHGRSLPKRLSPLNYTPSSVTSVISQLTVSVTKIECRSPLRICEKSLQMSQALKESKNDFSANSNWKIQRNSISVIFSSLRMITFAQKTIELINFQTVIISFFVINWKKVFPY